MSMLVGTWMRPVRTTLAVAAALTAEPSDIKFRQAAPGLNCLNSVEVVLAGAEALLLAVYLEVASPAFIVLSAVVCNVADASA